jgi:hypothetical protein
MLLGALGASFATGVAALLTSESGAFLVVWAHGVCGVAATLLVWKKVGVVRSGLRRRWPRVAVSLVAALLAVATLAFGFAHTLGVAAVGPITSVGWHTAFALLLVPCAVVHLITRPVHATRGDLTRANVIRLAGYAVAAFAIKGLFEHTVAAPRAATGSLLVDAPIATAWINDSPPRADPAAWRVRVWRDAVTLDDIARRPQREWQCVLDCTGGWYAVNRWRGVPLSDLMRSLPPDTQSVEVRSSTGYNRRFDIADLSNLLLATHLDGEPLASGTGAPIRLVAPGRRGFWWVKWVDDIQPSTLPGWWQSPFPLS